METKVYRIAGMTCGHCKDKLETHLRRLEDVDRVDADIMKNEIVVVGHKLNDESVKKIINGLGYSYVSVMD